MNGNKAPRKSPSVVREFKKACDDLAELVNEQLFYGCRKWYWIGDEVVAEPMPQNKYVENPEDMVRIIENNMTYDEYAEWRDANLDDGRYINLKSWLMGARHDMLDKENNR
mgnify:CR=1 FL=1